ncbi:hypothetical protein RN2511_015210 [Rhodococcus sp. NKCM2511]|nr:hypothetical protein RN2511_015210 [Rhodococcus sp. NKCM2511]
MLRYPTFSASDTAAWAPSSGTCHTPNPSWGIDVPSLSTMVGTVLVSAEYVIRMPTDGVVNLFPVPGILVR